jgi:hypothetical protein
MLTYLNRSYLKNAQRQKLCILLLSERDTEPQLENRMPKHCVDRMQSPRAEKVLKAVADLEFVSALKQKSESSDYGE